MLDKELQKLGLSDKEAKVYLSSLELGPSPVQVIAQKAGVNRATTYVMIESLIGRGLMSSFEKGKKRFFTAESPDQLMTLLKKEEAEVGTKIKQLGDMKMIFSNADEKPKVRFFEGIDGLEAIREDALNSKCESLEEIVSLDEYYKIFPPGDNDFRHTFLKRIGSIPIKVLYTSKSGPILKQKEGVIERRYISQDKFSFSTEIVIYGNKISISVCRGKIIGVIIENKNISDSLRAIFNLVWKVAEKY